ncbi:iron uptake porin [Microcoleus sp. LAD1_D5]
MGCLSLLSFAILNHSTPVLGKTVESVTFEEKQAREDIPTFSPATGIAQTTLESIPQESDSNLEGQVTSVNQLADVDPTDWAFQALQSLVERYGAIAGYPDSTFQGDRTMTRYEFAAALNAALEQINLFITQGTESSISNEDLTTVQRLQEEFATELATLRNRVDGLESRTTELESNYFSTTTRLTGQVIFAANAGGYEGDSIVSPTGEEITRDDLNTTFLYRVSLNLSTSFTGTDLLRIALGTGSNGINDNVTGVLEPNFGSVLDFSAKPARDGEIGIDRIYYSFSPREDLEVSIGPEFIATDYIDRNSYANSSAVDFSTQALVNNYILIPINGPSACASIDWNPGQGNFSIRAVYAAAAAANPSREGTIIGGTLFTRLLYPTVKGDRGLFGDTYQGILEAEYSPSSDLALRLQYSGGTFYGNRFDVFGANVELTIADRIGLFGRYGYGSYADTAFGDLNPHYWMAGVSVRDFLGEGNVIGIAASQPFIEGDLGSATQTNFEVFYSLSLNDKIRLTPVLQVITHPGNQDANGTIFTGTLRTVFSF